MNSTPVHLFRAAGGDAGYQATGKDYSQGCQVERPRQNLHALRGHSSCALRTPQPCLLSSSSLGEPWGMKREPFPL